MFVSKRLEDSFQFSSNPPLKLDRLTKMLLLLLLASFSLGHALNCTWCQSELSWEDCRKVATVETCTTDAVNGLHAVEILANPTLTQDGGSEDDFQCFAIHLRSRDAGVARPDRFSTGCTFKKTQFCEGWVNLVQVVQCGTSATGDVTFSGVGGLGGSLGVMILIGMYIILV